MPSCMPTFWYPAAQVVSFDPPKSQLYFTRIAMIMTRL